MRPGRWAAVPAGLALVLLGYASGSFVADPIGGVHRANEAVLRSLGASVQHFHAVDGRMLRTFVVGPLSAERPAVLLHGIGATADYFTLAARALARAGRTAVLLDFAGSGGSEPPAAPAGYGLDARVDAVASLLQALGLQKVDLVGHSLGGWTAGMFAIRHPEAVERLVLADPGGFTMPPDLEAAKASLEPRDRDGGRRLLGLLFLKKRFPLSTGFFVDALARGFRHDNVLVTLAHLGERDALLGRERELPADTRLIWGEHDALFPLADARALLAKLPRGRLYVVTGVGHDPPIEAPGAFHEALFRALDVNP